MQLSYYVGSQLLLRVPCDAAAIPREGETVTLLDEEYHLLPHQCWRVAQVGRLYRVRITPASSEGAAYDVLGGWEVRVMLHRPGEVA